MGQMDPIVTVVIDVQSDTVSRTSFGIPAVMAKFAVGRATLKFSAAFVASNVIAGSAGGQAYSVTYATSDAATFTALVSALGALTGVTAVGDYASRTITLELPVATLTCAVTGGASQATATVNILRNISRAASYASISELAAAGWTPADDVYKAVAAVFMQETRPASVVVGRRDTADSDWATALNAILSENDTWYFFGIVPVTARDTENAQAAAWAETQTKLFFAQSNDVNIITNSTADAASVLKALGYKRTVLLSRDSSRVQEFSEFGWAGEGAPYLPGSSTWAFKSITGSSPDILTSAQKNYALGKNANTYTTVAGSKITQNGKVAGGEWLDIVIGIDALTAELQETVFAAQVQSRKLNYDDGGITAHGGLIQGVLEKYGRQGVLQIDSIKLTLPRYDDVPSADRNARKLTGITFSALLQGAIHITEIRGTVAV